MFIRHLISNDPDHYEAWPDVALTHSGKLICVFAECNHHIDRSYTRIVIVSSANKGYNWCAKTPITESTRNLDYYYNCPRITQLEDGRLCIIVDKIFGTNEKQGKSAVNLLYFSDDDGKSWSTPKETPLTGIVPSKLLELESGRWIISAHYKDNGFLTQFLHYSDNQGETWSKQIIVGKKHGMNLCEASILELSNNTLVAFMRENSNLGLDCMKTISYDNGETWSKVINFPLPGCHRPVSGLLQNDKILITYRFHQGGKAKFGHTAQNFFAAITDTDSALALTRNEACCRIIPIDYDNSLKSDLGYSGWVQFEDGEIYIVSYIVDDALKGQIRGYSLLSNDLATI